MRRPVAAIWITSLLLWSVYGVIYAEQLVDYAVGAPIGWPDALWLSFAGLVACWVPISAALAWATWRWPLEPGRLWSHGAILLLAVTAASVARGVFVWAMNPLLGFWYTEGQPPLLEIVWHSVRYNFVLGWMLVGFAHAWLYAQRAQSERARAGELEAGLVRARLDALSAQLNPHFLFNALNAIAELTHSNPRAAERMLVALSMLLRRSLASAGEQQVALEEELELAAHYLDIEKIRFGDRLAVQWSIDPRCAQARVPVLLLQPLVENAVVHGIATRRAAGVVGIDARRVDARLVIEVREHARDGADAHRPRSAGSGSGIGLRNTRARLRCLYGDDWTLVLDTDTGGGSVARVELPFAAADAATPLPARAA